MTREHRKQQGFTLVEMLIVMIALGILAVVIVFTIGSIRGDAIRSACSARVRSIVGSAEAVKVKTSAYPLGTIDQTMPTNPLVAPQLGGLLKEWPTSSDFVLRYVGTAGTSYTIDVFKGDGATSVVGCSTL
jgi:prepilin-type N-terminal cleavage/methylation domain-containing protein